MSEVSLDDGKSPLGGFIISIANHHLFWMILETEFLGPSSSEPVSGSKQNETFPNNFPKCIHQHFLVMPCLNYESEFGNNHSPPFISIPLNPKHTTDYGLPSMLQSHFATSASPLLPYFTHTLYSSTHTCLCSLAHQLIPHFPSVRLPSCKEHQ